MHYSSNPTAIAIFLFFVGFVLAPLIVLAVGYVIFMFLAPD